MPFAPFHMYFPGLGERETRTLTVPPGSDIGLPPDEYGFVEMYCDERGCDCRRVLFHIISRWQGRAEAVVAWGWEDVEFYKEWFKYGGPADAVELKGPILSHFSPATEFASVLLEFVRDVLLKDPAYVERIKRHYRMFRDKIDRTRTLPRTRKPIRPKKRKPKKRR